MPKKTRSKGRRRNKTETDDYGGSVGDHRSVDSTTSDGVMDAGDFLSESHTIAIDIDDIGSKGTLDSIEDDLDWDIEQDVDHYKQQRLQNNEDAIAENQKKRQLKLASILQTVSEYSSEKQSSKREAYLKQWFKALSQYATEPPYQIVMKYKDDIVEACSQQALYRSASRPAEQYGACRVLEALGILIGAYDDELYDQTSKRLTRTVQSIHRATPVRAAALRASGMIVFCSGTIDDVITEQIMELCETIIKSKEYRNQPTPIPLQTSAYQVWTLLATTIHELYVSGLGDTTGRGIDLLQPILECLDPDKSNASLGSNESILQLKEAAGQAACYIHDCRLRLGAQALSDGVVGNATDAQYKLGSWEGTGEYQDTIDDLTQAMYQLAHASGHYVSKKTKKEQRAIFRDYLNMIQDNETPTVTVQFRNSAGSLELATWKDIVVLEYMKRCLQGGFQIQLLTNPTLQLMLGCDSHGMIANNQHGYSQLEKRLLLSKSSEATKEKDQMRHKGRDKRNNIKNHFLTADGDDI